MKLILTRHGQSEWNSLNLFCGWVDIRLTEVGKQEARNAAKLIASCGLKPEVVYTSRLSRSCQSANIILDELDLLYLDIYRSWRLNERHYGLLQGQKRTVVREKYGEEQFMKWRRSYDIPPPPISPESEYACFNDSRYNDIPAELRPNGESLKMVTERLLCYFYDEIKPKLIDEEKNVLIVAHGSTVRALVKHFSKLSDEDVVHLNIPTGIPLVYEFDKDMNLVKDYYYLDPEAAERGSKAVANQGFAN